MTNCSKWRKIIIVKFLNLLTREVFKYIKNLLLFNQYLKYLLIDIIDEVNMAQKL